MKRSEFEDRLQAECEIALKDIMEISKKYDFEEETLLEYGSAFLTGYIGKWLEHENIVNLNESDD